MSERAAGRELNIEIAERVFGEVEANAPCGDGLTRTATFIGKTLADCELQILLAYPQAIANGMKIWPAQYIGPDYSGDIAAALLVVDQMSAWEFGVWRDPNAMTNPWRARFAAPLREIGDEWRNPPAVYDAGAAIASHAICLAALAALSSSSGQGAE